MYGIFRSLMLTLTMYCYLEAVQKPDLVINRQSLEIRYFASKKDYGYLLVGVRFMDFDTFDDVTDFIPTKSYDRLFTMTIEFTPRRKAILDKSLNLEYFCSLWSNEFVLRFLDLKGFDLINKRLFEYKYVIAPSQPRVFFFYTHLRLYKNNRPLDASECIGTNFNLNVNTGYSINVNYFKFHTGTKYYRHTCKLLFANSIINSLDLFDMSDSIIKSNMLSFDQSTNYKTIKSSIYTATIQLYRGKVSAALMDEHVFDKLWYLQLNGRIDQIEADAFMALKNLFLIFLNVADVQNQFSKGLEWLQCINPNLNLDMSNSSQVLANLIYFVIVKTFAKNSQQMRDVNFVNYIRPYSFPDEDFCLFAQFPFQRLVFVNPHTVCVNANCSCTQYWLLKYVYFLNYSNARKFLSGEEPLTFVNYEIETGPKCNFVKLLSRCNSKSYSLSAADNNQSIMDEVYYASFTELILTILIPLFSITGIVMNIVNMVTIRGIKLNAKTDEIKQKIILKFMISYSIINLIYCVFHLLYLMNRCSDENGIFCSEIYRTKVVQYYKIIFVEYLGNVLKILSNLNYMALSLNRYVLLEKDSKLNSISSFINSLSNKVKVFLLLILVIFVLGLNVHYILNYKVLTAGLIANLALNNIEFFIMFPFVLSNTKIYDYEAYETSENVKARAVAYQVLASINFILFDILLFVSYVVTDILLVKSMRKIINEKKAAFNGDMSQKRHEQIVQIEKTEKTILKTVILNIVILTIIKVFDLFMTVSKFIVWRTDSTGLDFSSRMNNFCFTVKICMAYDDIVKLLYIISFSYSTILFANFNQKFKENLKGVFS